MQEKSVEQRYDINTASTSTWLWIFYEAHINANELDIVVYLLYFIIDYLALFSRN
jgi:hypothetical protein